MTAWFDTARFGLFVHWGHSSQQGIELSWPLVGGVSTLPGATTVGVDAYHATAATFDPREFDAPALARMAKRLGAQYATLTSKHHDGYAMWFTRQSRFSVEHSPCGRDLLLEFLEAFRAEGLRVGVYYSLIDWHHPDYPAFRDDDRPYRFGRARRGTGEQWERFLAFMFAQVRELLTGYGPIDVLWFDGHWERTPEEWKAAELVAMIRELQPGILINDRLPGAADFETPEQFVPAQPPGHRWEACMTLNESWGYNPSDQAYKSPTRIIHTMCEVAGRGGNLLLNVSPMGSGALPPEQVALLGEVERWMATHSQAIVGTGPGLEPWQFYGPSTRRGDTVYLHLLSRPYESVTVRGVPIRRVTGVRLLASGEALAFTTRCSIIDQMRNRDPLGEVTIAVPTAAVEEHATVLAMEIAPG